MRFCNLKNDEKALLRRLRRTEVSADSAERFFEFETTKRLSNLKSEREPGPWNQGDAERLESVPDFGWFVTVRLLCQTCKLTMGEKKIKLEFIGFKIKSLLPQKQNIY